MSLEIGKMACRKMIKAYKKKAHKLMAYKRAVKIQKHSELVVL